jgi:hypothetical protein
VYNTGPSFVAIYAARLADTPGWKLPGLKKRAKTRNDCMTSEAMNHFETIYMYGVQVPRTENKLLVSMKTRTKWQDSDENSMRLMNTDLQ